MVKFRLLNKKTRTILKAGDAMLSFSCHDNSVVVRFKDKDAEPIMFTGETTVEGREIYDGDIVEAIMITPRGEELFTDVIHWDGAAWRFGNFDGTMADVVIRSIKGNRFENAWPLPPSEQ